MFITFVGGILMDVCMCVYVCVQFLCLYMHVCQPQSAHRGQKEPATLEQELQMTEPRNMGTGK